jgi:MATE family multidrug resistance protein
MNARAVALQKRLAGFLDARSDQAAVRREVLRLALPAMGEQMLSMMVGLVDTYLVGHLGAAPLAAVGLSNQWVFAAVALFGAIATGSTALIARLTGGKDWQSANGVVVQSILLGAVIGLVATVLGVAFSGPALSVLGAEPDVADLGSTYLRIVSSIFFFSTLMFVGNACLRGAGDTRTPLYIMLVVNLLNIIVAWTAINGPFGLPKLGVAGSAVGAAAGRLVGGVLVIAILVKGRAGIQLQFRGARPDGDLIRRILHVGLPSGLEQLLFRSGHMVFARVVAGLGTVAYAANQVAVNAWSLSFMPGFGFALAATTLVGQGLGAGDPEMAERRGFTAFRMGATFMGIVGLLFLLFPSQIVGVFIGDPDVISVGTLPLRMVGLVQPILAAAIILAGALRGAGDTRFPMIVTGASIWLLRVPLSYILAFVLGWGLAGAWAAFVLDLCVRGVLNTLRFRAGLWKTIRV